MMLKIQAYQKCMKLFAPAELTELLKRMISIPSHKQVSWQEDQMAQFVYDFLASEGIEDLKLDYIDENRPNVLAKIPGLGMGKSLLFNGHLDTIPPYNMIVPPYSPQEKDHKIFGLGAVDMKGPIAAMLMAIALCCRAEIPLKGDLHFTGVVDQEQRSLGTVELVRSGYKVDYAIIGEPTNLAIGVAHKGMEWMKIIIRGKSAHGSTPEKGANAIYQAARVAKEIEKLNQVLQQKDHPLVGSPSINVGVISGGDDPNIVPHVCFLELDRRYTPEETRDSLYQEIKHILTSLKIVYPDYQCEVIPMEDRVCPLGNIPLDLDPHNELVIALQENLKEFTGQNPVTTAFRAWSDAALLHKELAIPSLVFGPGRSEKAHAADEGIEESKLIEAVKVYLTTIFDICGLAN